jgi:hypothetical protein
MSEGGEKKKIFINPHIFNPDSFTRKKKPKPDKPLKVKSTKPISDKTRRNQILKKIRDNQEKQYKSLFSNEDNREVPKKSKEVYQFESDFEKSVSFMNQIVDSRPKPAINPLNQTLRNNDFFKPPAQLNNIFKPPTIQSGESVPKQVFQSPTYGCLKNGSLPTYRSLHNTTVKNMGSLAKSGGGSIQSYKNVDNNLIPVNFSDVPSNPLSNSLLQPSNSQTVGNSLSHTVGNSLSHTVGNSLSHTVGNGLSHTVGNGLSHTVGNGLSQTVGNPLSHYIGRIKTPEEMELMRKLHEQKKEAEKPKPKLVQKKIKKLLRRTFYLGKDKYKPRVGVLLPNRTIRNNVTTKSFMIKQKPISEIRKFLLNKGFIKVGSTAPTDVLRKIYESIVLIDGDVKNHNPDNLLYNFFNDNPK